MLGILVAPIIPGRPLRFASSDDDTFESTTEPHPDCSVGGGRSSFVLAANVSGVRVAAQLLNPVSLNTPARYWDSRGV